MSEKIENIIEESLSPDRYCLVHNYIVSLRQKVEQLEKEIERLNNIINELEKLVKDYIEIYDVPDTDFICAYLRDFLDKLKELKEDNK